VSVSPKSYLRTPPGDVQDPARHENHAAPGLFLGPGFLDKLAESQHCHYEEVMNMRTSEAASDSTILYTIGYEKRTIGEYIEILVTNDVALVIDVRKNPLSRKKGFSKKALASALSEVGIAYRHLPELGIASDRTESDPDPDPDPDHSPPMTAAFSYPCRSVFISGSTSSSGVTGIGGPPWKSAVSHSPPGPSRPFCGWSTRFARSGPSGSPSSSAPPASRRRPAKGRRRRTPARPW